MLYIDVHRALGQLPRNVHLSCAHCTLRLFHNAAALISHFGLRLGVLVHAYLA